MVRVSWTDVHGLCLRGPWAWSMSLGDQGKQFVSGDQCVWLFIRGQRDMDCVLDQEPRAWSVLQGDQRAWPVI